MGIEIERKFLLQDDSWRKSADAGTVYRQGYLSGNPECSVRIRIEGERAALNIKSATLGISRYEFEYDIPPEEGRQLLQLFCPQTVSKTRYHVEHAGKTWEIDVFDGANDGLVVAEVELDSVDEILELPSWAGKEVSADTRYYNSELAHHPFRNWADK